MIEQLADFTRIAGPVSLPRARRRSWWDPSSEERARPGLRTRDLATPPFAGRMSAAPRAGLLIVVDPTPTFSAATRGEANRASLSPQKVRMSSDKVGGSATRPRLIADQLGEIAWLKRPVDLKISSKVVTRESDA